jgi:hypothetical protein
VLNCVDLDMEDEIERLEGSGELSPTDRAKLAELKKELAHIVKKKEEYVAENPEQRKLVFKPRRRQRDEGSNKPEDEGGPSRPKARRVFNKKGQLRHPERSVYYDPVYNPFGVPPPGMPYMERREPIYTPRILSYIHRFASTQT